MTKREIKSTLKDIVKEICNLKEGLDVLLEAFDELCVHLDGVDSIHM